MKKGIQVRDELIASERKAAGLESQIKEDAQKEFLDTMKDLEEKYDKDLEKIKSEQKEKENRDLSAEEASREIADKFRLRLVSDEDDE